jgi:hypothetical protein
VPASTPATSPPRRGAAPPAAVCFSSLIPSVRFRSNGPDRVIPLRARVSDALSRLSAPPAAAHPSRSDFPCLILIERLGPPRTPPRPISIERLGPPRTPLAVRFPFGAGPARSTRSPPLSLTLLVPLSALARPRTRALGRRSNLGHRF